MNAECLNCGHISESPTSYCGSCGQSHSDAKLSMWKVVTDFFESTFNLDSKLFKSLFLLLKPGSLTQAYVSGRRKGHINFARLFFVSTVIYLSLLLVFVIKPNANAMLTQQYVKMTLDQFATQLIDSSDVQGFPLDTSIYKEEVKSSLRDFQIERNLAGIEFNTDSTKSSPIIWEFGESKTPITAIVESMVLEDYGVSETEFLQTNPDSLIAKYNITNYRDKMVIRQGYKIFYDFNGAVRSTVANVAWALIPLILLMAFFMKLLYIRSHVYYVECLSILMNSNSFAFVIVSILLFFGQLSESYIDTLKVILGPLVLLLFNCYLFISLKRYFKQGYIKTLIKFTMISFAYFILLIFIIFLTIFVSAALIQ